MNFLAKSRWNLALWAGFLLVIAGLGSYVPFFALFPLTRDFPWVNILLLAAGGVLLAIGLVRAFRQPEVYRGRVFGSIFAVLSLAGIALFSFGLFYIARQLPPASGAPRPGEKAPDFTLSDQNGKSVSLADLLASPGDRRTAPKGRAALLIFYRGHW